MTTKAYLRKPNSKGLSPISIWYTHRHKWFAVSVGISVEPDHFDKETGRVKRTHDSYSLMNAAIEQVKTRLMNHALKLLINGVDPSVEAVSKLYGGKVLSTELDAVNEIKRDTQAHTPPITTTKFDFHKILEIYSKGNQDISVNTTKQYNLLRNNLLKFEEKKSYPLSFEGMDDDFFEAYSDFLLFDLDYYNNSWHKSVGLLKGFLNWAQDKHSVSTVNPRCSRWKSYNEEKDIIYLNLEELDKLYTFNWDDVKRKYVDLFVLACDTGFRISDLFRSRLWRLEDGMIYTTTKKTKGAAKVPITPRIAEILKRYDSDMRVASEQKANKYIKECIDEIGLNNDVTILRYKRKKEFESVRKRCDLVTLHCGRRSFISNCFARGFTETEILEMIGSKDLRTMKRYLKIETEKLVSRMAS
ncbi:integrase [Pontibacter aydingkolensis]|uniref:Phage integrase SAM-like domain-containing protein n=1 Tax=Pontibacter aydingkolensis TaxID=1911536 RepID=A0ABS7CRS7_9BACT|nr:tyrosine-type recombinase/integrase [Pontibacter aydingkolensis]MBW7466227.1 phage integrase SAM-like domain-containing protein [Pontibacter aydingkolensis]